MSFSFIRYSLLKPNQMASYWLSSYVTHLAQAQMHFLSSRGGFPGLSSAERALWTISGQR